MFFVSEKPAASPLLLVHGGAGDYTSRSSLLEERRQAIEEIINQAWPRLHGGESALGIAQHVIEQLEASPLFNAGLGSVIQSDGQARLTASVMDGARQKFSGVMLVTHLVHPSRLAFALQDREQTVLGPYGAQLLARELGVPPQNAVAPERAVQWAEYIQKQQQENTQGGHGTVGVIARDKTGGLVASTSTGGWSNNVPERISDVATVAGNYASQYAAISCTGIGEQIVDDAVAARIETRVRDGLTVIEAARKTLDEAMNRNRQYGWICLDKQGHYAMCSTQNMPCAVMCDDVTQPLVGQ